MFYEKLLSTFYEELKEIQSKNSTLLNEANVGITLCAQAISKMKKAVIANGFENKQSEIQFFKCLKVVPMQYLIYYTEVRSFELRMPKIGDQYQMKFLNKQVGKTNSFFTKYTEFLIYIDEGYEHFDELYFTREYMNHTLTIKSYPYYKDPIFNSSHDGILARIRGLGLYINYLKEKKLELVKPNSSRLKSTLKWTGSYSAFIEMIYGCDSMRYFNNGNIEIAKIIEELGGFLNVPKGNSSRTYNEMKNRKYSRIKFFEETSQRLLDKMNKEDGLKDIS